MLLQTTKSRGQSRAQNCDLLFNALHLDGLLLVFLLLQVLLRYDPKKIALIIKFQPAGQMVNSDICMGYVKAGNVVYQSVDDII
jgi:hypothetical protein